MSTTLQAPRKRYGFHPERMQQQQQRQSPLSHSMAEHNAPFRVWSSAIFKFNLIKIKLKNSLGALPIFQVLNSTYDWWLPYWTVWIQNVSLTVETSIGWCYPEGTITEE